MHLSRMLKLFGRGMTTAVWVDSSLKRMRPDFARATSRGSSVCACPELRSAGSKIAEFLWRTAWRTLGDSVLRYHVYRMRAWGSRGASLARRLIVTKQRWRTPKRANNSADRLLVSNWHNKNLSGWRRK